MLLLLQVAIGPVAAAGQFAGADVGALEASLLQLLDDYSGPPSDWPQLFPGALCVVVAELSIGYLRGGGHGPAALLRLQDSGECAAG